MMTAHDHAHLLDSLRQLESAVRAYTNAVESGIDPNEMRGYLYNVEGYLSIVKQATPRRQPRRKEATR